MKKLAKKYFIPHHVNNYAPHLLHEKSVLIFLVTLIALFSIPLLHRSVGMYTDYFASIISKVLVDLTNQDRTQNGILPLVVNPRLMEAARHKAEDMATKGYFSHTSPDGKTPWYWFLDAGYFFTHAGENLAIHFTDSRDVEQAWMNSPKHRANILHKEFTQIGIGTAKGTYQGQAAVFVVELFGRPSVTLEPSFDFGSAAIDANLKQLGVEVLHSDESFIAIRTSEGTPVSPNQHPPSSLQPKKQLEPVSLFGYLLTSPRTYVGYVYMMLAGLFSVLLFLTIIIEMEKQHPRHMAYALGLLVITGLAIYLNQALKIFTVFVL